MLSRVFIEFEQPQRGSQSVLDSVYIALKKRHMREPVHFHIHNECVCVCVCVFGVEQIVLS